MSQPSQAASTSVMPVEPDTAGQLLSKARDLVPQIGERAGEIEAERRVPPDLVEEMRRIGVFRSLVPERFGGLGLGIRDTLPILEELAIADASAGWIAMIGGDGPLHFAMLPERTVERIFADGPDVIAGGSVRAQQGIAVQSDGGWKVTGRWSFASGCQHADWLVAWCTVMKDGAPVMSEEMPGLPRFRQVALPASAFRIIENWDTVGLRGTASHDIALDGVLVPGEQTNELELAALNFDVARATLRLASVAIGIAEGALRDFVALDKERAGQWAVRLSETPMALEALGIADAEVKAARAYVDTEARRLDAEDVGGTDNASIRSCMQAAAWTADACIDAIQRCFRLAGTSAMHASSPLQRRLRDIHALSQHAVVSRRHLLPAASQRFGLDVHPITGSAVTPSRS